MRCAHVIPYMDPRAGGPVVVVDRFCRGLARCGHEALVITADSGAASAAPRRGDDSSGYELRRHRSYLGRFAYSPAMASTLAEIVPTCDLVHIHTLWTYATAAAVTACRRHRVPYVVMPHGMLDPNSLSRKALRKRLYGRLLEFPRLRKAAALVYTTTEERALAESAVPGLPEGFVVPLGSDPPPAARQELAADFFAAYPHLRGKTLVTFLGRIHPKKGLDLLVPAFAQVAARQPDAHLLIVGPDESGYAAAVQRNIARLGLQARVTRIGMLHGAEKWAALAASRLFVLPSYQENFALAVAEACRAGTPVVVSRRVNIWRDICDARAGLVIDCDAAALTAAILEAVRNDREWERRSQAAAALAERCFDWARSVEGLLRVYDRVRKTQPGCVSSARAVAGAWG